MEDLDEPSVAASPAPVPIRGRDDEFIRVSQVRKIKVNTMAVVDPPPKKKIEMEDTKRSPERKARTTKGSPSPMRRRRELVEEPVDDDDDDSVVSDCEPMDVIEKSPYELHQNAEYGVDIFTKLRSVLHERQEDDDYRTVSPEASKIFGPANAWSLVKATGKFPTRAMVRFFT